MPSRPSAIAFACLLLAIAAMALGGLTPRTLPLATNTILLCTGVAAATLPLSIVLAVALFKTNLREQRVWWVVLGGLLFFPLYLQAAGWNAGFGQLGWHTVWTGRVGAHWLSGWPAAIWIHTAAALPWATLIIGQGLRLAEPLEAVARLEARPWSVLWHVTLPSAAAAIMTAALWMIVSVAAEMTVADLFLIRTYAEELYTGFALEDSSPWSVLRSVLPSVLSLTLLALATAFVLARHAERWNSPTRANTDRPLFRGGPVLISVVLVMLSVFYLLPLGSLVWQAGDRNPGWSAMGAVHRVVSSFASFHREILWSLIIGGLTATLTLFLAIPLAAWACRGSWRTWPALAVTALGLATPGPLWALLTLWMLNRPVLEVLNNRTVAAPVIAITMRCLPLAIVVLWHAMRTTPVAITDLAKLEGANGFQQMRHIILPLRASAVAVAWLLSCAIAIGDLAASILVMPPAVETAAIRLFGLIHSGVREQEAGLALAMILVCAAISLLGVLFAYNGRRVDV